MQSNLSSWLLKSKKNNENEHSPISVLPTFNPNETTSISTDSNQQQNEQTAISTEQNPSNQPSTSTSTDTNQQQNEQTAISSEESNDIGDLISLKATDAVRYSAIKYAWIPPDKFAFPVSSTRNLKFRKNWLTEFHWLAYSKKYDGAFCRYCPFFTPGGVGRGGQVPKSLVTTAFTRWKDAKEQFRYHQDLNYHKNAVISAQNFIEVREKKTVEISLQLDKAKKMEIEQNRKFFSSIIETLLFLGRQGIAFRGHRDAGPLLSESSENDGNFRNLLRFRMAAGDDVLKTMLEMQKIQYTSPKIQNEIIEICGKVILDKIVSKIHKAKFFSILADETTDISGIEQFSLCARYIEISDDKLHVLKEDFLRFVPVEDVTGLGLGNTLKKTAKDIKLNFHDLLAQGYDGARAMSGQFKGCAAVIIADYPQAIYIHCANHSLNLAVSDSCSIPSIRNCLATINDIINFFRGSAKRQAVLNNAVEELKCDIKKKRLKKYCETRWIERLDAIITFKEFFTPIFKALVDITEYGNLESSKKANAYQQSLQSGNFIVSMIVIYEIFSITHPLSVSLQAKHVDLAGALEMTENLTTLFKDMRKNSEIKFNEIFMAAKELAEEIGASIEIPRITARQVYRDNYEASSPEIYYRLSVFDCFIDHFISHINERFLKHKDVLQKIENILPNVIVNLDEGEINKSIESILKQWPIISDVNENIVKKEALLWKQKWVASEELPRNFIDALNLCNIFIFPNVYNILKACATLPVTVASTERSFSTLKRIKTYLRNSTCENRLNGLATLNIHRDITLTTDAVMDIFKEKNRKISL